MEANYISKKADAFAAYKLTDEDKAEIVKLSKDPTIGKKVLSAAEHFNKLFTYASGFKQTMVL